MNLQLAIKVGGAPVTPSPVLRSLTDTLQLTSETASRIRARTIAMPSREHLGKELGVFEPGVLEPEDLGFWDVGRHGDQ